MINIFLISGVEDRRREYIRSLTDSNQLSKFNKKLREKYPEINRLYQPLGTAFGFLDHGLYSDLTVSENIEFFKRLSGASSTNEKLLLDRLCLTNYSKIPYGKLPINIQNRVRLASSYLTGKGVIICEELLQDNLEIFIGLKKQLQDSRRILIVSGDEITHFKDKYVVLRIEDLL